jgi:hypothetical protein
MAKSMGLDKSRLKIPIIDLASMTYLPEIKSKSYSNCVIAFTKDFTLSMELREICTVFMKYLLKHYNFDTLALPTAEARGV